MVLLKQYYQVAEKDTHKVTAFWKVAHIIAYVCIALTGFASAYSFGLVQSGYNYNCLLEARLVFQNLTVKPQHTVVGPTARHLELTASEEVLARSLPGIDMTRTKWGGATRCNFCHFMPVVSMITAIIWCAYFCIYARGGAGLSSDVLAPPWRMLLPALVFILIIIIPQIVSSRMIQNGFSVLHHQFLKVSNEYTRSAEDQMIDLYTIQFHTKKRFVSGAILAAIQFTKLGLYLWIGQAVLLAARILLMTDFQIIKVLVYEPKDNDTSSLHLLHQKNLQFYVGKEKLN